ncbi:csn9p [Saccharomyces arboricola H-6]|uniref:Csn9p n=1 Tax=Saccharomyces arboricola (strain H-6 / AS 2.3317 / CBS 10644) TaxID=1160507 RepID=J8PYA9_SACAR|nr:csn9p [Saccharomyces arboricola H-6]
MAIREEIIRALEEPHKYHYKAEWLNSKNPKERQLFEIFAFGDIKNTPENMTLTSLMRSKLEKLTLITLSEKYNELSYEVIRQECQIEDHSIIETHLIQLQDVFEVEMDSVNLSIKILKRFDCRDVYCHEKELTVIETPKVTKEYLVNNLRNWETKLKQNILE